MPRRVVDVRKIKPKDRHALILKEFDRLLPGESILLINDHDPIPLYYEMSAIRPDFDSAHYSSKAEEPEKWVAVLGKKLASPDQAMVHLTSEEARILVEVLRYSLDACPLDTISQDVEITREKIDYLIEKLSNV